MKILICGLLIYKDSGGLFSDSLPSTASLYNFRLSCSAFSWPVHDTLTHIKILSIPFSRPVGTVSGTMSAAFPSQKIAPITSKNSFHLCCIHTSLNIPSDSQGLGFEFLTWLLLCWARCSWHGELKRGKRSRYNLAPARWDALLICRLALLYCFTICSIISWIMETPS